MRAAIDFAVGWARDGDVVLVAGKGHEAGQTSHGQTRPFDDRDELAAPCTPSGRSRDRPDAGPDRRHRRRRIGRRLGRGRRGDPRHRHRRVRLARRHARRVVPGAARARVPTDTTSRRGAVAAGAVAVLAARPVGVPAIVVRPRRRAGRLRRQRARVRHATDRVPRCSAALAKLAAAVAAELVAGGLTIVGVTGSSGKTSTKDLLAAVLEPLGAVVAPPGSFNNELGHPWTVLRATTDTDYLILEMSARHPGNIAALARIAPPSIAVVLNVGTAHLGEFGSREAIAATKAELPQAVPASGVVILNADDPAVAAMADKTAARVVRVGRSIRRRRLGRRRGARRTGQAALHPACRRRRRSTWRSPCTATTRCPTRCARRPSRWSAVRPSTRWRTRWRRPGRCRGTGCRSAPAPTA